MSWIKDYRRRRVEEPLEHPLPPEPPCCVDIDQGVALHMTDTMMHVQCTGSDCHSAMHFVNFIIMILRSTLLSDSSSRPSVSNRGVVQGLRTMVQHRGFVSVSVKKKKECPLQRRKLLSMFAADVNVCRLRRTAFDSSRLAAFVGYVDSNFLSYRTCS